MERRLFFCEVFVGAAVARPGSEQLAPALGAPLFIFAFFAGLSSGCRFLLCTGLLSGCDRGSPPPVSFIKPRIAPAVSPARSWPFIVLYCCFVNRCLQRSSTCHSFIQQHRPLAGEFLPAVDYHVDVVRVELHAVCTPPVLLRRDDRRPAPGELVEDAVPGVR